MRSRVAAAFGLALSLVAGLATADAGPGPGPPLRPKPGNTDEMLWAKAERLQPTLAKHISPEGLLVYEHTRGAGPDELSHEVLLLSDPAIWTGCTLGAQACRWHVTRDPDALALVDRLLQGVEFLAEVTGVRGRLCRSAGRLLPGRPRPKEVKDSPTLPGRVFRDDVSRDQLTGVVFGLALTLKFVEDPAIWMRADAVLASIARRLERDGMWLRASGGRKTEFGELRPDVDLMPFVKNGPLAAIGYAPFVVMAERPGDPWWRRQKERLDRDGWRGALSEQHTWLAGQITMTNVNMVTLALTSIALWGGPVAGANARQGLRELYAATRGWGNAGTAAMQLLARSGANREDLLGELRVVLHVMPEQEVPFVGTRFVRTGRIAGPRARGISDWAWKIQVDGEHRAPPGAALDPVKTFTHAAWLFAYWIGRAAGHLTPRDASGGASR